jgi:trimeric autotransporter adhesin
LQSNASSTTQPKKKTKNMTTLRLIKSIGRSPLRHGYLLIASALCCFAFAPTAQAVVPPPDGGYPGFNTAEGDNALLSNTTGTSNTAIGFQALLSNTIGTSNTANGAQALQSNNTGNSNTANGQAALFNNTTGGGNTANGLKALLNNTTGIQNTANGGNALSLNRTGNGNVADGAGALFRNTGSGNTAVGFNAGANLTTGSDNVDIQALGVAGESNTMRIGTVKQTNTFIAGISGVTVAGGVGVVIDSSGHLGTVTSSARFKEAIRPMDKASEAILALKPVTFHYKHELDPEGIPQFGLVAEQVAKVNPALVARDAQGKVYTVRYEAVNAMLLNEFLKEHSTVQELKKEVAALTAGLQKVSAQLEASKPAPQMVNNP